MEDIGFLGFIARSRGGKETVRWAETGQLGCDADRLARSSLWWCQSSGTFVPIIGVELTYQSWPEAQLSYRSHRHGHGDCG